MLFYLIAGLCASVHVLAEDPGYTYEERYFGNDANYGYESVDYQPKFGPEYHSDQYDLHQPSDYQPEPQDYQPVQHDYQPDAQYVHQHRPHYHQDYVPEYEPDHPPQHQSKYERDPPSPPSYQPEPAYKPDYDATYHLPEGGRPFYKNKDTLPPGYESEELPEYWYKDADDLVRPSVTSNPSYIPREIMHFRAQFKLLKEKYPDLPLLSPDDFYKSKSDRYGRLGLGGNMFGGLMNLLFGGGFVKKVAVKGKVAGVKPVAVPGIGGFVSDFGCDIVAAKSGVIPCNGGVGVCQDCKTCSAHGGRSIGHCDLDKGQPFDLKKDIVDKITKGATSHCCCEYLYKTDSTTSAAISYFASVDFPKTTSHAFSTSLTLEVREDVDQILVEFEVFEMASGYTGCSPDDFIEVIAPTTAGGILGPGNNRFCGYNTDQHFYISVNPGDIVIFKAAVSGTGFVWNEHPGKKLKKDYQFRTGETRFKLKITQILFAAKEKDMMGNFFKNLGENKLLYKTKQAAIDPYLGMDILKEESLGYCGLIPEYYAKLRAPSHCRQYFTEIRGTFQNFNYDGKTCLPPNLDYNVCFVHPHNYCGLTMSAITFDIPTGNDKCAKGDVYSYKGTTCCTAGYISKYGEDHHPDRVTKFIGIDGTSDGRVKGVTYSYNQPRYFFCGLNLGKSNFVQSRRRGAPVVKVFSDWHTCDDCKGWHNQNNHGIGFKIKYGVEIGTC